MSKNVDVHLLPNNYTGELCLGCSCEVCEQIVTAEVIFLPKRTFIATTKVLIYH